MYKSFIHLAPGLLMLLSLGTQADVVDDMQAGYAQLTQAGFSSAKGQALWSQDFVDPKSGQERSCALCHTIDLNNPGKHARTGKTIEPMAPSVNPKRLSDADKIEKWFKRNCKWTLGRECTQGHHRIDLTATDMNSESSQASVFVIVRSADVAVTDWNLTEFINDTDEFCQIPICDRNIG